jgi:hypothetical protein
MKTILITATSVLVMSGAAAQTPAQTAAMATAPSAAATAMAKSDAKRDQSIEKHGKDLHARLKITAAEETQWAVVAKAMRDSAIETDKVMDKREERVKSASAVDNLNAYGDIAQAHADGVKKLATAFAPLYAAMPDEQKKLADEVFSHRAPHGTK